MQILLDFINMKEINLGALEIIYRTHRIFFTEAGMKKGMERYFKTKHSPEFFSFDHRQDSDFLNEDEKSMWLQPTPENEKKLASYIEMSQEEYLFFLDSCVAGRIDGVFLNERLSEHPDYEVKLVQTGNFEFKFELLPQVKDFEQYVDMFEIFIPIWRGEGEKFSRIKKCKFCGKYFFAVSLKAEFCERKCRNAYNYQKRR
jgi:hypothetical protein